MTHAYLLPFAFYFLWKIKGITKKDVKQFFTIAQRLNPDNELFNF